MSIDEAKSEPEGRLKRQKDFSKLFNPIQQHMEGAYQVTKYSFPDEDGSIAGFVAVYKSTDKVNHHKNGGDDLFTELSTMEEGDFHLERKAARAAGCKSFDLTSRELLPKTNIFQQLLRSSPNNSAETM